VIKFEKIVAGMVLYDVHSTKMGNTKLRSVGVWRVRIVEVYPEKRTALASWNGNPATIWSERKLSKLRAKEPELEKNTLGQARLKRKPKKETSNGTV
jgi:hypothetical protein